MCHTQLSVWMLKDYWKRVDAASGGLGADFDRQLRDFGRHAVGLRPQANVRSIEREYTRGMTIQAGGGDVSHTLGRVRLSLGDRALMYR